MPSTLQEFKDAAANLPVEARAELAQFLLHSLDCEDDADARSEWAALAQQRMADIKTGKVVGVPADEVLRSLPG